MRRVVVIMLALPLVLIATVQAVTVAHPAVSIDLVGAFVVAAAAVALSGTALSSTVTTRWTVLAAVATGVTFAVAATTTIEWALATAWSLAMLAGVLVARADGRRQWTAAVLCALACLLSPLTMPTLASAVLLVPVTGCIVLPSVAAGLLWRSQQRATVLAREAARDRERRTMAEELHDVVAHEITGVIVLAQAVRPGLTDPMQAAAVQRIETAATTALEQIRSLVSTLRVPSSEEPAPLPVHLADLSATVSSFAESVPADVQFHGHGLDTTVEAPVALAAERILIEALTNVRRHALSATSVRVEINCEDDQVRLLVIDDGAGGGVGRGNGSGVTALTARAELLGGRATAGRLPDGRWQVVAELPLTQTNVAATQRQSERGKARS